MTLNTMKISFPADLEEKIEKETNSWNDEQKVARVWKKDSSLWQNEDEADWLGWLDIAREELDRVSIYKEFYADIESAGFKDVLLMGMGGSSLCPEVLGITF